MSATDNSRPDLLAELQASLPANFVAQNVAQNKDSFAIALAVRASPQQRQAAVPGSEIKHGNAAETWTYHEYTYATTDWAAAKAAFLGHANLAHVESHPNEWTDLYC